MRGGQTTYANSTGHFAWELLLFLRMAPGEITFQGLARAISSLGISFRAGRNRKVSEHQDP